MRTIGSFLKKTRKLKKLTLLDLSDETKIKKAFLTAIENQEWSKLPEFPVVLGFVKSISSSLGLDRDETSALLRRDYPPIAVSVNPKPDIPKEFRWSPRLTFILGIGLVVVAVVGYLGFQYLQFVKPPELVFEKPEEGAYISEHTLEVTGMTDPEASVIVNTQPAYVDENGKFSTTLEVDESVTELTVSAVSRSGKETKVLRKIKVELKN